MTSRRWLGQLVVATLVALSPALAPLPTGVPVAAQTDPVPADASAFVPSVPTRVLDTRAGVPQGVSRFEAEATLTLPIGGAGVVPVDATAVILNVTSTDNAGAGFVAAWPSGLPRPNISTLNLTAPRQTRANLAIVPLGAGGAIELFASTPTEVIADVAGWFVPAQGSSGDRFTALDPTRLLDTRDSGRAVGAWSSIGLPVAGRGGVPASGASAVALTVTVVDAADEGFVTVWPSDRPRPLASNLNAAAAGDTVPNAVIVPLGGDGSVRLFTQARTDLVVDVTGWFGPGSGDEGLFVPVAPTRLADTRSTFAIRTLPRGRRVDLTIGDRGGIPLDRAAAAVVNLTATEAARAGFVTVHPTGSSRPNASMLNPGPNDTRAGLALARLGHDGRLSLFSSAGTELVADVTGYFIGDPRPPDPGVDLDLLPTDIVETLDAVLADPSIAGMGVTATVWVDGYGELYTREPDTRLIPASNQKLLTAVGALSVLPPDRVLTTRVATDGSGNLYLIAGGDPTLRRVDLATLAQAVRAAGIASVPGDIVVDARRHGSERRLAGWDHLDPWEFGPLSALWLDDNRHRTDHQFHADPDPHNGALFRDALIAAGVVVTGGVRSGPSPAAATVVASLDSPTIDELVDTMLTSSDNEIAEALLREIGVTRSGVGSSAAGAAQVAAIVSGIADTPGPIVDGSGLSHGDLQSSRSLVRLLTAIRDTPLGDDVAAGLPVAGERGTLTGRLTDPPTAGNVRAKTGTLQVSRALSGYVDLLDGTDAVFSIMVNAPDAAASRAVIDRWVIELASLQ